MNASEYAQLFRCNQVIDFEPQGIFLNYRSFYLNISLGLCARLVKGRNEHEFSMLSDEHSKKLSWVSSNS
jgi:hypothetical protein